MLTESHLAAIRERERAATPGPWRHQAIGDGNHCASVTGKSSLGRLMTAWPYGDLTGHLALANAAFAAHSRSDLPALLDELSALTNVVHDLQQDSEAYALGRASAFHEVLGTLQDNHRGELTDIGAGLSDQDTIGRIQQCNTTIAAVLTMAGLTSGHSPTPLPPEAAREEIVRLRKAMARIIADLSATHERGRPGHRIDDVVEFAKRALEPVE